MPNLKTCCAALSVWLLAGCAGNVGDPIFTPPPGSKLQVNQDLTAKKGGRIFIQDGQALSRRDVNVINPYCLFYRSQSESEPISVRPGTFVIDKAYRKRSFAAMDGLQYAGRAGSDRTLATVMELSSDHQPEINRMFCARWGTENDNGWVTIPEMQATLGGLVDLIIAQ